MKTNDVIIARHNQLTCEQFAELFASEREAELQAKKIALKKARLYQFKVLAYQKQLAKTVYTPTHGRAI